MKSTVYDALCNSINRNNKILTVLIDPEKFDISNLASFLNKIPQETALLFVGGSATNDLKIEETVKELKNKTDFPVILFPGDFSQLTENADAVLFLSLLSGRNPEYLINQQIKGAGRLKEMNLEVIPTAYLLIDGGNQSSVARITNTKPMGQHELDKILHTALAGVYMGAKMIYLEAGSGATIPVSEEIITKVKKYVKIPLIVGGGIKTKEQRDRAFQAGADIVVMGTVFEN